MAVGADKSNFDLVKEISKENKWDFRLVMDIINAYTDKKSDYLLEGKKVQEGKLGISKVVVRNVKNKIGDGVSKSYKIHSEVSPIFLSKLKKILEDNPDFENTYRKNSR